jgi:hypothetical protein
MRDRNTFAKRQRETGKKQKADEKRIRRQKRRESGGDAPAASDDDRTSGQPAGPEPLAP